MADYKRKNVKKLKAQKPKKSAVAENYKISSFENGEFNSEIPVKSSADAKTERKALRKKEKYLKTEPPKKRVVYTNKSPEELNGSTASLRVLNGTRQRKLFSRILAIALGIALIATITFFELSSPTGIIDAVKTSFGAFGSGSGFPVTINGNAALDIAAVGNNAAILSDNYIEMYNTRSKELFCEQHGYVTPKMAVSVSRALVYDQNSTQYSVYDASGKIADSTLKEPIVFGTVGRGGTLCIVTNPDDYAAKLTVRDKSNSTVFTYKSDAALLNTAIAANSGNYIAANTLSADNGKYRSKILVFSKKSAKPEHSVDYDGLIYSIDPLSDDDFIMTTDTGVLLLSAKEGKTSELDSGKTVQYKDSMPGFGFGAVFGVAGNGTTAKMKLYTKDSTPTFDGSIAGGANKVLWNDRYIVAAKDYNVYVYDYSGKLVHTINCGFSADKLVLIKDNFYIMNNAALTEMSVLDKQ